jgi:hypothetical protein
MESQASTIPKTAAEFLIRARGEKAELQNKAHDCKEAIINFKEEKLW